MFSAAPLAPVGFLFSVSAQGAEPPPTSGNTMTIFLGLTAFSLVVVIVGAAALRGLRAFWSARFGPPTLAERRSPDSMPLVLEPADPPETFLEVPPPLEAGSTNGTHIGRPGGPS